MEPGTDGFVPCAHCVLGIDLTIGEHYHTQGLPRNMILCCDCWRKYHRLATCKVIDDAHKHGRWPAVV